MATLNDMLVDRYYRRTNPNGFDIDEDGQIIDPPAMPVETPPVDVEGETPIDALGEEAMLGGPPSDFGAFLKALPDILGGIYSGVGRGAENFADLAVDDSPAGMFILAQKLMEQWKENSLDLLEPVEDLREFLTPDPPTSTPGKVAEGFSQALVGIIPATMFFRKVLGAATVKKRVMGDLFGGAVGDFATSGKTEAEGLVELVKMIPWDWTQAFAETMEYFIDHGIGGDNLQGFRERLVSTVPGAVLTPILSPAIEGLIKILPLIMKGNAGKELIEVFDEVQADKVQGSGGEIGGGNTGGARGERVSTTGQYIGAPKGIASPQALGGLRRKLQKITVKGEPGRFWYERSSRQILDSVGGDIDDADKLVQLIGIFSSGTDVSSNFNYALQAFTQAKAGLPIKSGRFPVRQSKAAQDVMDGIPWGGRKTNNFYNNLMVHIDPKRAQGVTTDIWIMRSFGFKNPDGTPFGMKQKNGKDGLTRPTDAQYDFVEREIFKIADEMGWEPQQVQAAIWVAEKARFEGTSVSQAKFDFADALQNNLGQVSWESIPGRTSGHMPEMFDAPYQQQVEYHQAVSKVFLDDSGNDIIAKEFGIPSPRDFEAPGYFETKTSPGTQTEVALPRLYKGPAYGKIDPGAEALVNAYAAARGILLKQDVVGWHRPFYNATIDASNGIEVRLGRKLSTAETKRLAGLIADEAGHTKYNPISSPLGTRIINFDYLVKKSDGTPLMPDTWVDHKFLVTNKEFHTILGRALDRMEFDDGAEGIGKRFASQNGYLGNDWGVGKNGEDYLESGLKGRPDLQRKVRDIVEKLAPRIDELDRDFSRRYGWTLNRGANSGHRGRLAPAAALAAPLLLGGSEKGSAELNEGAP